MLNSHKVVLPMLIGLVFLGGIAAPVHADDGELRDALSDVMDAISPLSLNAYGDYRISRELVDDGRDEMMSSLSRYSLIIGYEFADWVVLQSQWELYEASTTEVGGGLNAIQMQMDFELRDEVGIRLGRMYIPSSVENLTGEPLTYLTVNTSMVVDLVTPSGWADGAGVFGTVSDAVDYWVYVSNGLDASGFNGMDGLGGMNPDGFARGDNPALMVRLGTAGAVEDFAKPSWGVFAYYGGAGNGALANAANVDPKLMTFAGEAGGQFGMVYVNGLVAYTSLDGFDDLGIATESLLGIDDQAHVDVWPDRWAHGKLEDARLLPHLRYEQIQVSEDDALAGGLPAYEPERWTVGLAFIPVPGVGIKLDYQLNSQDDVNNVVSAGLSWEF